MTTITPGLTDSGAARGGSDDGLILRVASPMDAVGRMVVLSDGRARSVVEQAVGDSSVSGFPALFVQLPGTDDNYPSTPHVAALSVPGDIDIRFRSLSGDSGVDGNSSLVSKLDAGGGYSLRRLSDGNLRLTWYDSTWGTLVATTTSPPDISAVAVRVTLDADNGSDQRVIIFYTSTDDVSWTQHGSVITQSDATSIAANTQPLAVGRAASSNTDRFGGKIQYAEVRDGINGTVVARFDARDAKTGATSIVSKVSGETWAINQSGGTPARLFTHNAVRVDPVWGAPEPVAGDDYSLQAASSLSLTGLAPLVIGQLITPDVGSLVLSGGTSTVTVAAVAAPDAGVLSISGAAPGVLRTWSGAASLEAITATGVAYTAAFGDVVLQALGGSGDAVSGGVASGSALLQALTGSGYGPVYGDASLKPLRGEGSTINAASGEASLRPLNADNPAGYAVLQSVVGYGLASSVQAEVYVARALNVANSAVTEYSGFRFNSFAKIGGKYYGAGPDGLVELGVGKVTDWSAKTGQMDDKSPELKRLPEIVVGLRADGPIRVRVYPGDTEYYDYVLPATKTDTIRQQRVKPGKGMRSRYFAVELAGENETSAEIDSMQVNTVKTTRRIG